MFVFLSHYVSSPVVSKVFNDSNCRPPSDALHALNETVSDVVKATDLCTVCRQGTEHVTGYREDFRRQYDGLVL